MKTEFQVLKAEHGDSILIKTYNNNGDNFVILIDGGTSKSYNKTLKKQLELLKVIDLVVLTHIDADHIKGLIKFLESDLFDKIEIKKYWFNSRNIPFLFRGDNISYGQAVTFESLLVDKNEMPGKWDDIIISGMTIPLDEGISAEIISPTKEIIEKLYKNWPNLSNEYYEQAEDILISSSSEPQVYKGSLSQLAQEIFKPDQSPSSDVFNTSSIAFVLRTLDMRLLLLGDARPEIYIEGLKSHGYNINNPLHIDYVKVSHHGSMNNTTVELADIIECENYIISTNGGLIGHRLPDRETIARIIYNPERVKKNFPNRRTIYFNYPLNQIEERAGKLFSGDDFKEGNWQIIDDINSFN